MTNNNTAADKLRTYAATAPLPALIDAIEDLEDRRATLTESERIAYAVSVNAAVKRLGLNVQEVAQSLIGPAAYLRVATIA